MIEVEIKKVLNKNSKAKLVQGLNELGYEEKGHSKEVDVYYSRPDVDYMKTVECLRIRERDDSIEMTYKPPTKKGRDTSHITAKKETNLSLEHGVSMNDACTFLANIGMQRLVTVDKRRRSFIHSDYSNLTVAIDEVKGAGSFVEIEVISSDVDVAKKIITEVENKLCTIDYPVVTKPYRDLVMEGLDG